MSFLNVVAISAVTAGAIGYYYTSHPERDITQDFQTTKTTITNIITTVISSSSSTK